MLLLSNSLRGRFGYQLSYVLSKSEGNVDNSGFYNYFAGGSRLVGAEQASSTRTAS